MEDNAPVLVKVESVKCNSGSGGPRNSKGECLSETEIQVLRYERLRYMSPFGETSMTDHMVAPWKTVKAERI